MKSRYLHMHSMDHWIIGLESVHNDCQVIVPVPRHSRESVGYPLGIVLVFTDPFRLQSRLALVRLYFLRFRGQKKEQKG